jgi:uncharacterized OB-fold protein
MTALFEPPVSESGAPFWDATRERKLVLPWCVDCDRPIWYPREICPVCLGDDIEWRPSSGLGAVHAVSVHHLPGPMREPSAGPYAVALVDLTEGVRIMTNVVNCEPEAVRVGMAVRVTWHPLSDGRNLPQFQPA